MNTRETPQQILTWLNDEQRRADRWVRVDGIFRFTLAGPEVMRIRQALEGIKASKEVIAVGMKKGGKKKR